MNPVTGKTVYVLGAGASCHAGAPLLNDFLVTARILHEGREELKYDKFFERVFKWLDTLRGASYYVEFDLDNLEHVFSLAEMMRQLRLEDEDGEQLCSDLRWVIMETLDWSCVGKWRGSYVEADELYKQFASRLQTSNDKRRKRLDKPIQKFQRDVIITFNYDVVLEHAMGLAGVPCDYCLDGTKGRTPGIFKVLKLHGSTNWGVCRTCKGEIQPVEPNALPQNRHFIIPMENGQDVPLRIVTEVLAHTSCKACNKTEVLEPVTIPPTWSKKIDGTPLAKVWATAVKEIKEASQIVVIGYSMPPTDTFFQYLMTLGLAKNPRLHRVVIVNKDNSDEFKDRYRKVFSRRLDDRGRLKFLTDTTFKKYVYQHMKGIGNNID